MSVPVRVLFVEANEDGTTGGSHESLLELMLGLDRTCIEPVALFYQDNVVAEEMRQAGFEVLLANEERDWERRINVVGSRIQKAAKLVRAVLWRRGLLIRERIAIVHLNDSPQVGSDDWLPAARLAGVPIVTAARYDAGGEHGFIRRLLFRSFDRVLANSDFTRGILIRQGMPPNLVQRVYPGLDIDRFRQRVHHSRDEVRAALRIPVDKFVVAMVANLREWKGQHVLLSALSLVPRSLLASLHVLLIGATAPEDRRYHGSLVETIERESLSEYVTLLGFRRDIPDLMNASDLIVHASVTPEPFGRVIAEAMALGKVVIAANSGGPLEILTADSGVTFDTFRPLELSERLVELASDSDRRARLSAGALDRVAHFGIERSIEQTMAAYAQLLPASIVADCEPGEHDGPVGQQIAHHGPREHAAQ